MERLTDALDRTDFDKRMKRVISVMPGVLFGFPPANCSELIARIDCPICGPNLDRLDEIAEKATGLSVHVDAQLSLIRQRNADRRTAF